MMGMVRRVTRNEVLGPMAYDWTAKPCTKPERLRRLKPSGNFRPYSRASLRKETNNHTVAQRQSPYHSAPLKVRQAWQSAALTVYLQRMGLRLQILRSSMTPQSS
jgi:predicted NodU family carbamoyl transferase